MGFLDSLSKTLSTGVDRARFEAERFQRTTRISGEVSNVKSQIDTNMRQLGERTMELYDEGRIDAPEIASLAQIIRQLRNQQAEKENELNEAQNESFEAWLARQPQPTHAPEQPVNAETMSSDATVIPPASATDTTTSAPPFAGATGGEQAAGNTPYACTNCGYQLPNNAVFCPNCGTRVAQA